jgi:hypothetical protein
MWGALSLTRGRVCRLQLLLALASADIFGSDSHGTCDHNLLSQIRDFPFRCLLRLAGLRWRYSTPPLLPNELPFISLKISFIVLRASVATGMCVHRNSCPAMFCFALLLQISRQRPVVTDTRLAKRPLTMDHSGFQASCHNTYVHIHIYAYIKTHLNTIHLSVESLYMRVDFPLSIHKLLTVKLQYTLHSRLLGPRSRSGFC